MEDLPMSQKKINAVMCLLQNFALETVRLKALEIIAKAQYNPEYSQNDIEQIRESANEFLCEIEKVPFQSQKIEILTYRGVMPQEL